MLESDAFLLATISGCAGDIPGPDYDLSLRLAGISPAGGATARC